MQSTIVAGDTLKFKKSLSEYPASAGWALSYRLVPRSGSVITINATTDGDSFLVNVAASTTANYAAGPYEWNAYVTKAGESYTIESGRLTIKPDPRQMVAGTDTRSHARKTLE